MGFFWAESNKMNINALKQRSLKVSFVINVAWYWEALRLQLIWNSCQDVKLLIISSTVDNLISFKSGSFDKGAHFNMIYCLYYLPMWSCSMFCFGHHLTKMTQNSFVSKCQGEKVSQIIIIYVQKKNEWIMTVLACDSLPILLKGELLKKHHKEPNNRQHPRM